jgi:hypothetical protein
MMVRDNFYFKSCVIDFSKKLECCCDVFFFRERVLLELKRIIIADCKGTEICLPHENGRRQRDWKITQVGTAQRQDALLDAMHLIQSMSRDEHLVSMWTCRLPVPARY